MKIYQTSSKVIQNIDKLINQYKSQLISVDGMSGSGKSYLSKKIVEAKNFIYVDLDGDYLIPNTGQYIDYIRYEELKSELFSLLRRKEKVLIDGICVLEILFRIGFHPDITVYVKRIHNRQWRDRIYLDYTKTFENALNAKINDLQKFENDSAFIEGRKPDQLNNSKKAIFYETLEYHFAYQPDIKADIIFERTVKR